MSYHQTIQTEAQYVDNLGFSATEDKFRAIYRAVLSHWFPTSRGYIIDHQVQGEGGESSFTVIRHAGGHRHPLLIVKLKRPSNWSTAGQNEVWSDLQTYIEGQFEHTRYNTIYGVGGIGLHWMACKMEASGGPPALVQDWQTNIASDTSYTQFQAIADLVYNTI